MVACDGCKRVAEARQGKNPHLIAEFEQGFLFLGDHQFYEGYCVLMLKEHVRELHEMPAGALATLNAELMRATRAVQSAFKPWKMNHACLGNLVQHVHWHILPRYESDSDRFHNPWFRMNDFSSKVPDEAGRKAAIARIQEALDAL